MNKPPDPIFVLRAHKTDISALCFISDDACESMNIISPALISGSKSGEIFIWNLRINRVQFKLLGQNQVLIIFLGYFGKYVISQGKADFIYIWDHQEINDEWVIIRKIRSPDYGFCPAAICRYNFKTYFVIPSGETGVLNVMDFESEHILTEIKAASQGMCMCIKVCLWKEEMFAACGFESGTIITWSIDKGIICNLNCHKEPVFCLDIDILHKMNGVSGSADCTLKTWHIEQDFNISAAKEVTLNSEINCTAIRKDGKIVIAGCWNGDVHVFSWKNLKPLAILNFHKSSITCLCFHESKVGKHNSVFGTGSKEFNIALWTIY